uniref:Protein kinase domain-containing protein n=1 Tax=Arcella intermedia TaxID=1963864 RepID=A0A6B2L7F3_9EUKA
MQKSFLSNAGPASNSVRPPTFRRALPNSPASTVMNTEVLSNLEYVNFTQEFSNIMRIDSGGFGVVYKANWRNNSIAVKQIKLEVNDRLTMSSIKSEVDILCRLRHDRTLTLLHCCRDDQHIYLVTKFYEKKSLYHLLHESQTPMNKDNYCILMEDICNGLTYLHNNKPPILHLDLKPKNILIDGYTEFRAVIADFGLSVMTHKKPHQIGGTFPYMAPEILTAQLTDKADIYSLAIVMWESLMYREPYSNTGMKGDDILTLVSNGMRPKWDDPFFQIPPSIQRCVEQCWHSDPQQRPNAHILCSQLVAIHQDPTIQFLDI